MNLVLDWRKHRGRVILNGKIKIDKKNIVVENKEAWSAKEMKILDKIGRGVC